MNTLTPQEKSNGAMTRLGNNVHHRQRRDRSQLVPQLSWAQAFKITQQKHYRLIDNIIIAAVLQLHETV